MSRCPSLETNDEEIPSDITAEQRLFAIRQCCSDKDTMFTADSLLADSFGNRDNNMIVLAPPPPAPQHNKPDRCEQFDLSYKQLEGKSKVPAEATTELKRIAAVDADASDAAKEYHSSLEAIFQHASQYNKESQAFMFKQQKEIVSLSKLSNERQLKIKEQASVISNSKKRVNILEKENKQKKRCYQMNYSRRKLLI